MFCLADALHTAATSLSDNATLAAAAIGTITSGSDGLVSNFDGLQTTLTNVATFTDVVTSHVADAWSTWVPVFKQGVIVTHTVSYAKYKLIGKTVMGSVRVLPTSAGTAGQDLKIEMPLALPATNTALGSGQYYTGASWVPLFCKATTDGLFAALWVPTPSSVTASASSQYFDFTFMYETA